MLVRFFPTTLILLCLACQPSVGPSFTLSEGQLTRIDSLFATAVAERQIPGAVALIGSKDSILLHQAWGNSQIRDNIAQTTDDIFRLASMTKPITAVAAMMLYEQGAFELDDSLATYIPAFRHPEILDEYVLSDSSFVSHPATKPITIRQLFTHSSGIGYGFQNDSLMAIFEKHGITEGFEERDILLADNIDKIAQMPLLHEPGLKFTYGLNSDVLGRLIEIWSGQSLDEYLREHIFEPLDMRDTYFYLADAKAKRLTPVYMSQEAGVVPTDYPLIDYPIKGAKRYYSGGADLNGTARDYYRFCQMLLRGGSLDGQQILQAKTIDLMTQDHLATGDMGLGFGIQKESSPQNLRSKGSYSWGGFFATTFWIDPEEEIIAILLLQVYPFDDWEIQNRFEQIIYTPS